MSTNVGDLEINPRIVAAVKRVGLNNAEAVLNLSGPEIERLTALSTSDITQLKDAVSEAVMCMYPPTTALELWKQSCSSKSPFQKLSTGCPVLDRYLRGGVLTRGITEIVGESAAGKTQLCLQLCLTVQLPSQYGGLGGGAVYICTEDVFPSKRLQQLAREFSQLCGSNKQMKTVVPHFSDNIFVEHVADFGGLDACLQKKLPLLLSRGVVKLVVVDSVAALFRCHYENHNLVARAKHLASLATCLRRLSDQHSIPIVCVNQVSANMSDDSAQNSSSRQSVPALGLVWADHVTCRLLMSRQQCTSHLPAVSSECTEEVQAQLESGNASLRQLEVMFAPHLPTVTVPLLITGAGVSCRAA